MEKNSKRLSRRTFIKGTAIGVGVGITGLNLKEVYALPAPQKWNKEVDVIIIGAGGAGFCAAIEACKAGAKTLILEKEPVTGGSSAICGGSLAFAPTSMQKEKGINDSPNLFYEDLLKIGKGRCVKELVRTYADESNACYEFLVSLGVKFQSVEMRPGLSVPRVHRTSAGDTLNILKNESTKLGAELLTRSPAKRLYANPQGRIIGVKAKIKNKDTSIKAKRAVILTTGGFAMNKDMLKEYSPLPLESIMAVSGLGTTGDGIKMAMEYGAAPSQMTLALSPITGVGIPMDVNTKTISQPNYAGAVIVNKEGKRFVNESVAYTDIALAGMSQTEALIFHIADEQVFNAYKASTYSRMDRPLKADTLEELASKAGIASAALVEEINKYNGHVAAGNDPDFGRKSLVGIAGKPTPIKTAPFYAYVTKPGLIATMGGIKVNTKTEVINVFDEAIPGLYAAGEVTGGMHGAGYHTGSGFGKALVFGRIAGKKAANEKPQR
ncbi:MAG: flavocytochrome c [Smithella sp.]|nr:flavocytochrome c [Smithella sp.]